jgi:hypothetical protein
VLVIGGVPWDTDSMVRTGSPRKALRKRAVVGHEAPEAPEVTGGPLVDHELVDQGVGVMLTDSGRAFFVPRSVANLRGEAAELVADIQTLNGKIYDLRVEQATVIAEARALGVSWPAIGWSIGTTGEAARQRFGGPFSGRRP